MLSIFEIGVTKNKPKKDSINWKLMESVKSRRSWQVLKAQSVRRAMEQLLVVGQVDFPIRPRILLDPGVHESSPTHS